MKKKITLLVSLLLIASLAVCVCAASIGMTLNADKTSVNRGDTITVAVSVAELASCKSGLLQINYNKNYFSCSDNEWLLSDLTLNTPELPATFGCSTAQTVSGEIYRFKLKVSDSAPFGKYSVDVSVMLTDASGNPYTASASLDIEVVCKHSYSEEITKAPTCTDAGEKTYTCTVDGCGHFYTETVKALEHSYDGGTVTTQPTCTDAGVKTFKCTRAGCTHTTTETVKALDHSYDSGTVTHPATCTTAGEKTFTCTRSGCTATKTDAIKATGHSYDHECDPDCNVCGEERTDLIHNYSTTWKFDENGHWHACTRCGDELEMEKHVPSPEATETTDQICTACGYVIEKAKEHTHTATGDWLSDENGHWHLCGCGETMNQEDHSWDAGVLDEEKQVMVYTCTECGYSREEVFQPDTQPSGTTDPTQTPTSGGDQTGGSQSGGLMWLLIVLCIIGVGLLAAIIFVVIGIVVSKKQNGRFTGKK